MFAPPRTYHKYAEGRAKPKEEVSQSNENIKAFDMKANLMCKEIGQTQALSVRILYPEK